jgi:hypothetical protein
MRFGGILQGFAMDDPTAQGGGLDDARQRTDHGQGEDRVEGEGERITADDAMGVVQNEASSASHSRPSTLRASRMMVPTSGAM